LTDGLSGDTLYKVNDADEARALVTRFYDELWNRWDDDAVEGVLAAGFVFRGSLGQETTGRDGWRRYRDRIRHAAPDFHNEVVDLVAASGRAAARLEFSGTHLGPLLGIAPSGRRFSYSGAAFFVVADRRLSRAWVLGDLASLRGQLA
jgi:steroid delta-isomerase-like uncharacterized protein